LRFSVIEREKNRAITQLFPLTIDIDDTSILIRRFLRKFIVSYILMVFWINATKHSSLRWKFSFTRTFSPSAFVHKNLLNMWVANILTKRCNC
jgi:hypothetical protein